MLSSSVEVHCGSYSWKIATFQYKLSFGSSGSKIRIAVQVRSPHLCKDLAARKGLRTQNALKAYANAYAGPTRSLRGAYAKTPEKTEGRQKKQIHLYLANSTES